MTDRMSRREWLATAVGAGVAGLAGCGGGGGNDGNGGGTDRDPAETKPPRKQPWKVRAPQLPSNSLLGKILEEMRAQARDLDSKLELVLVSANYNDAGMEAFGANKIDTTLAPETYGDAAYNEENPVEGIDFAGDNALDRKPIQLFNVYTTDVWWVTTSDDISTFDDLSGTTIGVPLSDISAVAETGPMYRALLKAAGVLGDVELVDTYYTDIPQAFEDGDIDVAPNLMRGDAAPGWMQSMTGIDIVRMTDEHVSNVQESTLADAREVDFTDVGPYMRQRMQFDPMTVQATSFDVIMYAQPSVRKDVINTFVSAVLNNQDDMRIITSSMGNFSRKNAAKGLSARTPVHAGAAQYLKSKDLWRDELTAAGGSGEES